MIKKDQLKHIVKHDSVKKEYDQVWIQMDITKQLLNEMKKDKDDCQLLLK